MTEANSMIIEPELDTQEDLAVFNDGITDLVEDEFTKYKEDFDPFTCCTPEAHCNPYSPFFNSQAEIDTYEADLLAKTRSDLRLTD